MKTVSLDSKQINLQRLLKEAESGELLFLTVRGNTCFVLAPADDSDREICALRSNAEFMAHLAKFEARPRTRPRKTLQQVKARLKKDASPAE